MWLVQNFDTFENDGKLVIVLLSPFENVSIRMIFVSKGNISFEGREHEESIDIYN